MCGPFLIFKVDWIEADQNSKAVSLMMLPVLLNCKGQEGPFLWQPAYLHPPPNTGNLLWLSLSIPTFHTKKKKKKKNTCLIFPFYFSLTPIVSIYLSTSVSIAQIWYKFLDESRFSQKTRVFLLLFLFGMVFDLVVCFVFLPWCCGIIVPRPGIEPRSRALKVQSLNHSITREFHKFVFFFFLTVKAGRKGLPSGSVVKNLPASAGDMRLIPDQGRSHVPRSN